jgi:cytoskeletal protein CcmA (bactofilin family)
MKKFFYGMAVLLSVSLFVIGCEGAGDPGAAGVQGELGPGSVDFSGNLSVADINAKIKSAGSKGTLIFLSAGTTITGSGIIDFGSLTVALAGDLTTGVSGNVILKLQNATIDPETTGKITAAQATDLLIAKAEQEDWVDGSGNGAVVQPVNGPSDFADADSPIAIENYTLGVAAEVPANKTVYVYGDLTVNATSLLPTASGAKVVAIGDVLLTADNTVALADATIVDVTNAVIKASTDVSVTLPTMTGVGATYKFDLSAGTLTLAGTVVNVDVKGAGTLELAGNVTEAKIIGTGKVYFSGTPTFATASSITAASIVFDSNVSIGAVASTITATTISFKEGFKSPSASGTVTFDGDVRVGAGKTIGFGNAAGTITLAAGSKISSGGDSVVPLLTVASDAVLTGSTTTLLDIGADGITQKATSSSTDNELAVDGTLSLVANWTVTKETSKEGDFVLAKDAVLKGTGSLVAGNTKITGGTDGWKVTGTATETVTITINSITSSAASASLTAQSADSVIEVTAETLTVTGKIDITNAGTVKLTGASVSLTDTSAVLLLKAGTNAGVLIVDSTKALETPSVLGTVKTLTDSAGTSETTVTVTGSGPVVKTATDATLAGNSADLGSIAGASATNDTTLTGPDNASSEIVTGWKIAGTN